MDSDLIKKARALMQKISEPCGEAPPSVIEAQPTVVSAEADVIRIMDVWRRLFGFSEREHIETSLRNIRHWLDGRKRPRG
jgi:hypothetical protein